MRAKSGFRLAVVLSHPTQYYSPWFRWLRSRVRLELRVFYLWDFGVALRRDPNFGASIQWDVDLLSGYDSEFVANQSKSPGAEHFLGFSNPHLTGRLAGWEPDAVLIFGYKWLSHLRAIAWATSVGVPVIFRGDSHLIGRALPAATTRLALGLLFSHVSAFLYVGSANRAYFKAFGVPDPKLFFAPHSVDDELFDPRSPLHQGAAAALRSSLGISRESLIILFAGKLVAAKQPGQLLQAFLELSPPDATLVFVGEGPEKDGLKAMGIPDKSGGPAVHFLPFANQSEMPSRYLMADLFVLPSKGLYETWGLAVNEAMHMGLPCVVSTRVGSQIDLVTEGVTGWVFDPGRPPSLKDALARALADLRLPTRRQEVRQQVKRRILGFTYARTSAGLLAAIDSLQMQDTP